jgi:hypothetical protein
MRLTDSFRSRIGTQPPRPLARFRPQLEALESRVVPYSVSGNAWPRPEFITISFVPDGTNLNGVASDLFARFNAKFGSPEVWQGQILKAAQQWALRTNINFAVVGDNGAPLGSGGYQQGDPNFGDIRIGGYNFGGSTLAQAYLPPPVNNYSIAGDFQFNTGQVYNIGSTYDLYSVSMHEFGHVLGLYHGKSGAVMYSAYGGAMASVGADDIDGIQRVYSNDKGRSHDAFDAKSRNETLDTPTAIGAYINSNTKTAVIANLDLTTTADVDAYRFTAPSGSASTLTVTVQSEGFSLLAPRVQIYNASDKLLATANGAGQYGSTVTATFEGVVAGRVYYVKVTGVDPIPAFQTGKYALIVNLGSGDEPTAASPDTRTAEGQPLSGGGGAAVKIAYETQVNTTVAGKQQTATNGHKAVATDVLGNYVVTWASQHAVTGDWDVYARRYNASGQALGDEFRVNTTTLGNQVDPTVALDPLGNVVIAWTSYNLLGTNADIYARRFTLLGIPLLGDFRVNGATAGNQTDASVATDDLGNFVVTWTSTGSSGSDIYARLYTVLGLSLLGEFRVNTTTAGDQADASLVMNRLTGDFTITWASKGQDAAGSWGIYARQYNLLGLAKGAEFRVNTTTAGDQLDPSIAINRFTGAFTITWSSQGVDGSWDIFGRAFQANGTALGSEFAVNSTTAGDQTNSSAAMDSGGNLFVTWTSTDLDGSSRGVFGQQFTSLGELRDAEFAINSTTAGDQDAASIAIDFRGQVIVVWSGNGEGDSQGVYFQRFSLATEAYEPDGHDHADPPASGDASPPPLPTEETAENKGLGESGGPAPGSFALPANQRQRPASFVQPGSRPGLAPAGAPTGTASPIGTWWASFSRIARKQGMPQALWLLDQVFEDAAFW